MDSTAAPSAPRVLIIDDEPDLARLLEVNLAQAGFETRLALAGEAGLAIAPAFAPAVVVVDLMLPDLPGTEVCRRLRASPATARVGILVLTASGEEASRVRALEHGADDFVGKPYSVREVVLRVKALVRRLPSTAAPVRAPRMLRWRTLVVDATGHHVFVAERPVQLRPMEYRILLALLEEPERVFTREELLEGVFADGPEANARKVDVHVRRLRAALGPGAEDVIETVHGFGYRRRDD